jgi:hypothetical protein
MFVCMYVCMYIYRSWMNKNISTKVDRAILESKSIERLYYPVRNSLHLSYKFPLIFEPTTCERF